MALGTSRHGLTLQFFDADGDPVIGQQVVYGSYVALFSNQRPDHYGDCDPQYGSQDWLTDVLIADSALKLDSLVPSQIHVLDSSTASKQVQIQWNSGLYVSNIPQKYLTLAWGNFNSQNRYIAEVIWALPGDTVMDPNHKLWKAWKHAANNLEVQLRIAKERQRA